MAGYDGVRFGVVLEAGQLWKRLASGETHVVVCLHGGMVRTKSVEGGYEGLEGDFMEQFERILSDTERGMQAPGKVARRQGRSAVLRTSATPERKSASAGIKFGSQVKERVEL